MYYSVGYHIMLVVMTYNAPLFICVILGLVREYILFSAQEGKLTMCANTRSSMRRAIGRINMPCQMALQDDGLQNPLSTPVVEEENGCCCKVEDL